MICPHVDLSDESTLHEILPTYIHMYICVEEEEEEGHLNKKKPTKIPSMTSIFYSLTIFALSVTRQWKLRNSKVWKATVGLPYLGVAAQWPQWLYS
ncbi:hypothetical protein BDV41DRAFT_35479 [Aspergillus transmontanensis]|uniref:Uncharacterized protein n=1 Tax=Aspergillus transmontanensis TaxID=1034304 RepID=A0A5N6VKP7_9EURO|nr:hypothetical protein BDV41DRAFT_35479 [Aspergillus transmontanensis]